MNQHSTLLSPYTQESLFEQAISNDIMDMWQTRQEGKVTSFDNTKIYWCRFTHPQHSKMLLILNGRVESTLKYQELFFDLFNQGYDIYSLDHRGQGLSDRLTEETQLGHVSTFEHYIDDITTVLAQFSLQNYRQRFLLGHSMGGAIAIKYIQTHLQHEFHAMALTAPMLGLHIPLYVRPILFPLVQCLSKRQQPPKYAPGYQAYNPPLFENNPLTHSQIRYQWFRKLYETHPELQLGGPSTHWVWQSLLALKRCHQQTQSVNLPTLIVQAGSDTIVNNASHQQFYNKLRKTNSQCILKTIPNARHELLFETDFYRNQTLDEILSFFASIPPLHDSNSLYKDTQNK